MIKDVVLTIGILTVIIGVILTVMSVASPGPAPAVTLTFIGVAALGLAAIVGAFFLP